ncbi:hypothetical protein A3B60_04130 [Candidatus Peregrinibacteria bacterium RIFCSPLOWO2_01_FULL_39_12]|nr:MAG: hypothetical protein A3B60_04130 [Candidatus Peregrinibacteria bacterium RIFCSPLOWO2_01_FULL_39_12]
MHDGKIEIYTDGSCLGNPGFGGWGAIILFTGEEIHLSGGEEKTTNNRMEMMAVIKALEWMHNDSGLSDGDLYSQKIIIYSDSNLLIQSLNQGWKRKANKDLWESIERLRAWLDISWTWVKGHDSNKYNNLVDKLAVKAAEKFKKKR